MNKILVAGDFVPRYRIANQLEANDFSCLDRIKPFVKSVDYSIVNFESPVVQHAAKPIDKTGPNLRCSEKAMECIAKAGFNCVSLANNHFRDYGQTGVEDTIAACCKYGVDYVGGGKDIIEAEQVLYKGINDKTLAIINVCENEWSIAEEKVGGSAPLNIVRNYYTIREAKQKADNVLVIVHGGIEGCQYPAPRMLETYRFFVDAGADAVVNHHQHCYSGYEVYKGKPIFYGLGNLCFDYNNSSNRLLLQGYMVILALNDNDIDFELVPYNQCLDAPVISPMGEDEKRDFANKINQINTIISDLIQLESKISSWVNYIKNTRLLEFEPFSNNFIRKLQKKGILPSFVSKKTRMDVFNVVNCESHRDVILRIYSEMLCQKQSEKS